MAKRTAPPPELGTRGRRLWASCLARDESLTDDGNPMRHVLTDACRLADHLDQLAEIVDRDGLIVTGRSGPVAHPALKQVRNGQALLARLLTTLRMPDAKTQTRPQRRGGTRAPYNTSGSVTSLDRARKRAQGPS